MTQGRAGHAPLCSSPEGRVTQGWTGQRGREAGRRLGNGAGMRGDTFGRQTSLKIAPEASSSLSPAVQGVSRENRESVPPGAGAQGREEADCF